MTTEELKKQLEDIQNQIKEFKEKFPNYPLLDELGNLEKVVTESLGVKSESKDKVLLKPTEGMSDSEKEFLKISNKYDSKVQERAGKLRIFEKKVSELEEKLEKIRDKRIAVNLTSDEVYQLGQKEIELLNELNKAKDDYETILDGAEGLEIDRIMKEKIERDNIYKQQNGVVNIFEDFDAKRKRELKEAEEYRRNMDLRTSF